MAKPALSRPAAKTLAAVLGSAALAVTTMTGLNRLEGNRQVGYRDIVGVVTACQGVTGRDAVLGKVYTPAECARLNEREAIVHAEGVLRCTPRVAGNQLVAATLLTYNIGSGAYCHSTIARRFNAGDLRGGCEAFRAWNRAGGRVIRGLAVRREFERGICVSGLR